MIKIEECTKIKLKTGEIAKISEVLKENTDYIAEVFKKNGNVEVEQISYDDIASVFIETEKALAS